MFKVTLFSLRLKSISLRKYKLSVYPIFTKHTATNLIFDSLTTYRCMFLNDSDFNANHSKDIEL